MDEYRRTRLRYIVIIAVAILAVLFIIEYVTRELNRSRGDNPITDVSITETYPDLYEAVFNRSAVELKTYLNHKNEEVRKQAWRALANTPVETDSLDWFVEKAMESGMDVAWFALGLQSFTDDQLRQLEQWWLEKPEQRGGISRVMGQQGDEQTLHFLLDNRDEVPAGAGEGEYDYALAVGRLMTRYGLKPAQQLTVIRKAFNAVNSEVTRAYLYGFYRGNTQHLNKAVRDSMYQHWWLYGLGKSADTDQYIAGILKQRVFYEITMYYNSEELLDRRVQLGVELARVIEDLELTSNTALASKVLLMHRNPIVVQQTLAALKGKLSKEDHLFTYTRQDILGNTQTDDHIWIQALETAADLDPELIEKYSGRLRQIRENQPYLLPRVLGVWKMSKSPEGYLDLVESIVQEGDPLKTQYAIQALAGYWADVSSEDKNGQLVNRVREIVFDALSQHDRGVVYVSQGLLLQEDLFGSQDFNRINSVLSSFQLPEDIEVYQAFGSLYKERFEEQAQPVIDSLAAREYVPLNRSLSQAGWEVPVSDDIQQQFRTPDWEGLWELGRNPIWVLSTEKGDIRVQMDVLSAPATVSAIDSLTLAGAYDGVPFHRVVPNFVIQGGDIERRDGFGGPDFVIPTEASEKEYDRGAAGIASAGPDTEGSQYFFMHYWSPHLNGRYTLFGNVIEGMEVVDRIVVGDKVERAYWD